MALSMEPGISYLTPKTKTVSTPSVADAAPPTMAATPPNRISIEANMAASSFCVSLQEDDAIKWSLACRRSIHPSAWKENSPKLDGLPLNGVLRSSQSARRSRSGKVSPAEPTQDVLRHLADRTLVRDRLVLDADPDGGRHPRGRLAHVLSPARRHIGAQLLLDLVQRDGQPDDPQRHRELGFEVVQLRCVADGAGEHEESDADRRVVADQGGEILQHNALLRRPALASHVEPPEEVEVQQGVRGVLLFEQVRDLLCHRALARAVHAGDEHGPFDAPIHAGILRYSPECVEVEFSEVRGSKRLL